MYKPSHQLTCKGPLVHLKPCTRIWSFRTRSALCGKQTPGVSKHFDGLIPGSHKLMCEPRPILSETKLAMCGFAAASNSRFNGLNEAPSKSWGNHLRLRHAPPPTCTSRAAAFGVCGVKRKPRGTTFFGGIPLKRTRPLQGDPGHPRISAVSGARGTKLFNSSTGRRYLRRF